MTRDSLQEAFFDRPRQQSMASCLDQTTKFLNPHNQGYEVANVLLSSDEDSLSEYDTNDDYQTHNNYSNRIVSGLEDSLRVDHRT